jgi:hypothetical protein
MDTPEPGTGVTDPTIPTHPTPPTPPAITAISAYGGTSPGVTGLSTTSSGVLGEATSGGQGVTGQSSTGIGVIGHSLSGGPGLLGQGNATGPGLLALANYEVDPGATSAPTIGADANGVLPTVISNLIQANPGFAALFSGNVFISDSVTANDVRLAGADFAEEFDLADGGELEPGTVVVMTDDGDVDQTDKPFNKRVAGVISGAGAFRPGIVLDRRDSQAGRAPVALVGKVYCKVDAQYGAIEVGDLLTTSPTRGSAMKAANPEDAFGSVLGKALAPHAHGPGLIPVLMTLQ